ncbi:hypothetical protein ABC347_03705 [Sphingomonas sp. 1P06PA]|uniref:hypothetical protein n=1 Tax=Sphingomonas sp. 1P06PA TaxID=554121 RepID=UPI0039A77F81
MALAPSEIVCLWEQGVTLEPLARAVLLAAGPEQRDAWDWPLDRRDRALMTLLGELEGAETVDSVATCASCGEPVALAVPLAALIAADTPLPSSLRAPTSRDLADALALPDAAARRLLAARASRADPDSLDAATVDRIEVALEGSGAGDIRLDFACPSCGAVAEASFDPAALAWRALTAAADTLLHDIDRLARTYGWSDTAILALAPARRQRLLELAQ